jgi:hypothetical protein
MTALIHTSTFIIFSLEIHGEQVFPILLRDTKALICDFNVDTDLLLRSYDNKLINRHRYSVALF